MRRLILLSKSGLSATLAQDLPYDIGNDGGQFARQAVDLQIHSVELAIQRVHLLLQSVDLLLQAVDLALDAIEAGFDRGQVLAVAAGLFKDVTGDELLTFDFALDDAHARLKFVPGDIRGHWCGSLPFATVS